MVRPVCGYLRYSSNSPYPFERPKRCVHLFGEHGCADLQGIVGWRNLPALSLLHLHNRR